MTEDFVFDGLPLSDFNYVITHDGVVDEEAPVSTMAFTTVKSARSDINHKVATPYEDTYHTDITISKNPCQYDDMNMTNDEISEMAKWLCRKDWKWFRWLDDIGQDEIWYEVQITMDKQIYGDSVIGLILHVNANRPYGLTREYVHNFDAGDYQIILHSDEEGYIYPDMEITVTEACDVSITNHNEERTMLIKNCSAGEVLTIYGGDNLQITTNLEHDLSDDFNYKFFRLCNRYNEYRNNITIDGNVTCKITYRGIRKVGL